MWSRDGQEVSERKGIIQITLGTLGSALTIGLKGFRRVPDHCLVTGWSLVADQAGSVVVDVWKDSYGNFPPTVADTIAGTEKPTLAAVDHNRDLDLTSWTTKLDRGDWLAFNVDSAATVEQVILAIHVEY